MPTKASPSKCPVSIECGVCKDRLYTNFEKVKNATSLDEAF
jgi:hypothetical protein